MLGNLGAACEHWGKRTEPCQWWWCPQELELEGCVLGGVGELNGSAVDGGRRLLIKADGRWIFQ